MLREERDAARKELQSLRETASASPKELTEALRRVGALESELATMTEKALSTAEELDVAKKRTSELIGAQQRLEQELQTRATQLVSAHTECQAAKTKAQQEKARHESLIAIQDAVSEVKQQWSQRDLKAANEIRPVPLRGEALKAWAANKEGNPWCAVAHENKHALVELTHHTSVELASLNGKLSEKEIQRKELQEQVRAIVEQANDLRLSHAMAEKARKHITEQFKQHKEEHKQNNKTGIFQRLSKVSDTLLAHFLHTAVVLILIWIGWQSQQSNRRLAFMHV